MGAGRFLSVIAWALGCVPAGAQHRVGLFTRDLQSSSFYIAEIAVDGLPKDPTLIDAVAAQILPGTLTTGPMAAGTAFVAGLTPTLDTHFSVIDVATGRLVGHPVSMSNIVVEAIVTDRSTNTTYVAAFQEGDPGDPAVAAGAPAGLNHIYSFRAGALTSRITLPNITVEIGTAALCEESQTLFLTARDDDADSGVSLVRVDLAGKKVLSNVALADDTNMIMYSAANKTLLAWTESEAGVGELVAVDPASGLRLATIASFPNLTPNGLSGSGSTYDPATHSVIATLTNMSNPGHPAGTPVAVSVNLLTGATSTRRSEWFAFAMDAW